MKLLRLGAPGFERPAVLADDGGTYDGGTYDGRTYDGRAYDLTGLTRDIDGSFVTTQHPRRASDLRGRVNR
ncbi:hypothetical protein ABS735_06810 [Streptomyces sp. MMCC 100]|uniref:hypothetical protein n=1 Tax=Streptomyces sp. MMCC 100 TaxID=3163555 RepID=UPI0035965053